MTSEIELQSFSQFTNNNEVNICCEAKQLFDSVKKRIINRDI